MNYSLSDLQMALIGIGVLVIIGVIIYNRVQEHRFKSRAERAFAPDRGDALFEPSVRSSGATGRIEPQWSDADEPAGAPAPAASTPSPREPTLLRAPPPEAPDPLVDYTIELAREEPFTANELAPLREALVRFGTRLHVHAEAAKGTWTERAQLDSDSATGLRLRMQLVDRSGPATAALLEQLGTFARAFAESAAARCVTPPTLPYAEAAAALDELSLQVDVQVGINVVGARSRSFAGTKVRGVAEAAGFSLDADGSMRYKDDGGAVLFRLMNEGSEPFSAESMSRISMTGLTLLLDVARVADGQRAFDRMVAAGKHLATSLGGLVVDDNRKPVTDEGFDQIRKQLREIYALMEKHRIKSGSPLALRLFS